MGFETATPVQEQAIPQILNGKDLMACAQTGTGKTAAFILPILNHLAGQKSHDIKALVIVPTRELALQIDREVQGFAYFLQLQSIAIYGGGDGSEWNQQKQALIEGADIVIATPGKLMSHLNLGYVKLEKLQFLILDEADRMLDMGFIDDIQHIISFLPKHRQNLMFSATMPPKIRKLAKKILHDPYEISLALSKPAEGVLQAAYLTHNHQKIDLIRHLIKDKPDYESILIFSSTKKNVAEIVRGLQRGGEKVQGISSDLEQTEREAVLAKFKARRTRILVATDVLSRGIDIKDINLVINYDAPNDAEDYVHRVGRTARADATGVALTLVNEEDMYKLAQIEKLIEQEVMKISLPPELGEGPKWRVKKHSKGWRKSGGKNRKRHSRKQRSQKSQRSR